MKTVYVPKGETVFYDCLTTEHLIVDGGLNVIGDLHAKAISGQGSVAAHRIIVDDIRASNLEAERITCRRLIAEWVETAELYASESATVSGLLLAEFVQAKRVATALSSISEVKADEVVNMTRKKRGMLRFLLVSSLMAWWMRFITPRNDVVDADYEEDPSALEF